MHRSHITRPTHFAVAVATAGFLAAPASAVVTIDSTTVQITAVPEPAGLSLLEIGGLGLLRRRKRQSTR